MTSLFCLHGFAGAPCAWRVLAAALPPAWNVHAARILGHGGPSTATGFEAEVERLAAEAASLPRPRQLCGYSLGGRLALGLLVGHPHLFERAVVISASPGLVRPEEIESRAATDEAWAQRAEREGLEAFLQAWEAQSLFASQRALGPERLAPQREARAGLEAAGLAHALRVLSVARMPSYWSHLGELTMRVDLVAGEHDVKYVDVARRTHASISGSRFYMVRGVGHNVLLEAPEQLARIVAGLPLGGSAP